MFFFCDLARSTRTRCRDDKGTKDTKKHEENFLPLRVLRGSSCFRGCLYSFSEGAEKKAFFG